jgi:hypothetical protein
LMASWRSRTKIAGSGSGAGSRSIGQRHGFADPEPDSYQNVTNPRHCFQPYLLLYPTFSTARNSSSKRTICGFDFLDKRILLLFNLVVTRNKPGSESEPGFRKQKRGSGSNTFHKTAIMSTIGLPDQPLPHGLMER